MRDDLLEMDLENFLPLQTHALRRQGMNQWNACYPALRMTNVSMKIFQVVYLFVKYKPSDFG